MRKTLTEEHDIMRELRNLYIKLFKAEDLMMEASKARDRILEHSSNKISNRDF